MLHSIVGIRTIHTEAPASETHRACALPGLGDDEMEAQDSGGVTNSRSKIQDLKFKIHTNSRSGIQDPH